MHQAAFWLLSQLSLTDVRACCYAEAEAAHAGPHAQHARSKKEERQKRQVLLWTLGRCVCVCVSRRRRRSRQRQVCHVAHTWHHPTRRLAETGGAALLLLLLLLLAAPAEFAPVAASEACSWSSRLLQGRRLVASCLWYAARATLCGCVRACAPRVTPTKKKKRLPR